ncbi:MAG: hypothetical protein PSY14_06725 [bacterium]|nr:hypothetical protein [bacterium]
MNSETDITIINQALVSLGSAPINSITNIKNDRERICATLYPPLKDQLLTIHPWSFSQDGWRQLAVDAGQPAKFGYTKAFKLPTDMLAGAHAVFDNSSGKVANLNYEHADNFIYCDFAECWVKYCKRPAVTILPAYFIGFLRTAAAALFAKPIADNTELGQEKHIEAYGQPAEQGRGGLFKLAREADARTKPIATLFRNGDPLSQTRR